MVIHKHIERLDQWVAPSVCLLARSDVSNRGVIG